MPIKKTGKLVTARVVGAKAKSIEDRKPSHWCGAQCVLTGAHWADLVVTLARFRPLLCPRLMEASVAKIRFDDASCNASNSIPTSQHRKPSPLISSRHLTVPSFSHWNKIYIGHTTSWLLALALAKFTETIVTLKEKVVPNFSFLLFLSFGKTIGWIRSGR